MKSERQIAEQIFQLFRDGNRKDNECIMERALNDLIFKLNPKEREILDIVFVGLQALEYISTEENKHFIRLTKKGYDYIYDDDIIEKMQHIPWVIPKYKNNTNWIAAWNKLWNVIGTQDSPFYITGQAFISLISKVDDSIETNYNRYMNLRRNKGLSTSKKDYFRDLIDYLDEEKRYEFYVRMQQSFESSLYMETNVFDKTATPNFDETFPESQQFPEKGDLIENLEEHHPKIFISYSWDSEEHKKWVLDFATKLCEKGVDVILDQWEISSKGGSLIPNFMIQAVSSAERVLCIMTPNYKLKTDNLEGGAGFEYSILSSKISEDLKTTKFIPILRNGDEKKSIPILLDKRIRYFMRDEDNFDNAFEELLRDLYNEPKTTKPVLGKKPKFD